MRKHLPITLVLLLIIVATGCTNATTLPAVQPPATPAPTQTAPATAVPTLAAPTATLTPPPTITPIPETPPAADESPQQGLSAGDLAAVVGLATEQNLELKDGPTANAQALAAIPPSATGLQIGVAADLAGDTTWLPVTFEDKTGWADSVYLARQYGQPPDGLAEAALKAIQAIRTQDFPTLATMVGDSGLRLSPYSYIRDEDQTFTSQQIGAILADSRLFHWGVYDGSGEPIDLSFPAYYEKFIYDVNFAQPQAIGFNTIIGTGNTIDNLADFYPGADFVEYHFYSLDPQYSGMDWRSLRLVFQPSGNGYKLVGIVHDQWTI